MKRRLYHPLWVHLPAVGMIVWVIVVWVMSLPLPVRAPIHFSFAGEPDSWGAPNLAIGLLVGMMIVYLGLGVLLDELWARGEKSKRFNWMTALDEAMIAWMAVMVVAFVQAAKAVSQTLAMNWYLAALAVIACVATALELESKREYAPVPLQYEPEGSDLPTEVKREIAAGTDWTYWESQNPWWNSLLAVGVPALMVTQAAFAYLETRSVLPSLLIGVLGIACVGLYGGFRTTVTRETLTCRIGLFGIPLMKTALSEIASVEPHEFHPLREFGGYGIRFNRQMKGFFLRGNTGVLITDIRGRKTLIGSDNPERLVAVIQAAKEAA